MAVDHWLIRHCRQEGKNSVVKNELRQKGPVRSTQELDQILTELANLNRVRLIDKRPATIEVSPALLGGG